jgi:membrane-associated phospholipid phosphatase
MTLGHARHLWSLIAIMGALTVVSLLLTHLTVDVFSNPALFVFLGVLFAANCFYRFWRPDPHLQAVTEAAGQILLILLFGILLSYAAVAADFSYRDVELDLADKALGFDRSAYLAFFAHRPRLAWTIGVAYLTLLPQFALIPLILFSAKQQHRLQSMILAFGIALLATDAISIFTPSVTAFVHLDLPSIPTEIARGLYTPVPTLDALRSGTPYTIKLDNLEGLISFPSFHTAGALLFAWALLKVPYIRWLGLALNAALIAATPVNGAHYFVDLLGGAAVAGVSLAASALLFRRPRLALSSSPLEDYPTKSPA